VSHPVQQEAAAGRALFRKFGDLKGPAALGLLGIEKMRKALGIIDVSQVRRALFLSSCMPRVLPVPAESR
jgi:hypothetical protein